MRIAIWWSSNGPASMVCPLISYGFGSIGGSLPGRKNIYLFAGLLTFVWSAVVFKFLPDEPRTAKFLTEREKFVALERVNSNNTGLVEHRVKPSQIKEALLDPAVLLLASLMFGAVATNSTTGLFASVIISSLGFNSFQSLCLQIPVGLFGICCGILPTIIILKTNKWRTVILACLMTLSVAGTAILYAAPRTNIGVMLLGYYLNNFYVGCPNLVLALAAANIGGHTQKSTASAAMFIAYCAGSIMSPLIMKAEDHYSSGFLGILICQVYTVVASQAVHFLYLRRNNKAATVQIEDPTDLTFTNLTDRCNKTFHYAT
jgi:hypothetical protein